MKKKLLSRTYLNEAEKYRIKFFLDEEDYYVSVKHLIHITENFYITHNILGMADGYYIMEIVPKSDNYALRIFFNEKKEVVEYYFDIIKNSGIDKETKIPYFNDLYLDITLLPTGELHVIDEEELTEAVETKDITKEDYELVLKMRDKLLEEIKNNTNKLLNINFNKYLGEI